MFYDRKFVSFAWISMCWLFSGGSFAFGFGDDKPATIDVTGTATLKTTPDRLRLNVDILARGATLDEAMANLAKRRTEIAAELAKTGADPKSIRFGAPRENELFQRGFRVLKSIQSITEAEKKQLNEEEEKREKTGETSHVPTPLDFLLAVEQIFTGEDIDYDAMNAIAPLKSDRNSTPVPSSTLPNERMNDDQLPRIPAMLPAGSGLIELPSSALKMPPNPMYLYQESPPSSPLPAPRSHLRPLPAPRSNQEDSLPALAPPALPPPGLNQEDSLPALAPPALPPPGLNQEDSLPALAPPALPPPGLNQEDSLRAVAPNPRSNQGSSLSTIRHNIDRSAEGYPGVAHTESSPLKHLDNLQSKPLYFPDPEPSRIDRIKRQEELDKINALRLRPEMFFIELLDMAYEFMFYSQVEPAEQAAGDRAKTDSDTKKANVDPIAAVALKSNEPVEKIAKKADQRATRKVEPIFVLSCELNAEWTLDPSDPDSLLKKGASIRDHVEKMNVTGIDQIIDHLIGKDSMYLKLIADYPDFKRIADQLKHHFALRFEYVRPLKPEEKRDLLKRAFVSAEDHAGLLAAATGRGLGGLIWSILEPSDSDGGVSTVNKDDDKKHEIKISNGTFKYDFYPFASRNVGTSVVAEPDLTEAVGDQPDNVELSVRVRARFDLEPKAK